jgi:hypothetical protein
MIALYPGIDCRAENITMMCCLNLMSESSSRALCLDPLWCVQRIIAIKRESWWSLKRLKSEAPHFCVAIRCQLMNIAIRLYEALTHVSEWDLRWTCLSIACDVLVCEQMVYEGGWTLEGAVQKGVRRVVLRSELNCARAIWR